jgi:hypothetical protein
MKTKATIRTQALTESAVNGTNIRRRAEMSLDEYRQLFFETACEFIDHLFDVPGYDDMKEFYLSETASKYWKWWRAEWINHEREVYYRLKQISKYGEQKGQIIKLFKEMITSDLVHESFKNHTKSLLR